MSGSARKVKILSIATHPVRYQVPVFRLLARQSELDLTVGYCSDFGTKEEDFDKEFNRKVRWGEDELSGYRHKIFWNPFARQAPSFRYFSPGLVKEVIVGGHDVIWLNAWNSVTHWLVIVACIIMGKRMMLRAENPLSHELLKSGWKRIIKRVILGKFFFPRVNLFLYIGKGNKEFYRYYGVPEDKLFFTPYAVDNNKLRRDYEGFIVRKEELRRGLGIDPSAFVVLSLGSKLIEKKRPFDLLRAYELLSSSKKALVFIGEGELRQALEEYIRVHKLSHVYLVGFQPQDKLVEFFALADAAVLASGAGETWGLMVNEAMNFKLPIVASSLVGCAPDLVRVGENGFIFPCGDYRRLAEILEMFSQDKTKRAEFGERSAQIVQSYSYEQDADGIQAGLRQLFKL